ncbi:MAG: agmatine deiminase family protein [Phycisphaeraceae bacterium]
MTMQAQRRMDGATMADRTAAELGYRMPAEWEAHAAVWVSWPENVETWPGVMDAAREQFDAWVEVMRSVVPVCTTQALGLATDDAWIRDYGPIFVVRDADADAAAGAADVAGMAGGVAGAGPLALHDFRFDGWGGKYGPRALDDAVPAWVAKALRIGSWQHDVVVEGGAIDVDGRGTALVAEASVLDFRRNPGLSRAAAERLLAETLDVRQAIWLRGNLAGDDTDGHVDNLARFVAPDVVALATAGPEHPDHATLQETRRLLEAARTAQGRALQLVDLPMPEPVSYDFPPDRWSPGGREPLPASYANFLITNGAVFVPAFGQPSDDHAARVLEGVFPGRRIMPVRCEHLIVGLGGLHCLSQQQPAGPGAG